jgi:membrane-associated HD superfamily phosphohydrolase|tara:strand:- start:3319 stop:4068 length:750 start_codon:yes stop_codon:yes gene_type:complete
MGNLSEIIIQLKNNQATFLKKLEIVEKGVENATEEVLRDLIQDAREIHEGTVLLSYFAYNETNMSSELEMQESLKFEEHSEEEELLMSALDSAIEHTQKDIERTMVEPQIISEINDVREIIEASEMETGQDELIFELENSISDVISTHSAKSFKNNVIELEDNSLAAKLANKKIDNLTTSVGINEKFLFTNELFDGNTEQFIKTITELNNFNSLEEATGCLTNLVEKNSWEMEETPYLKLLALVERKYL